MGEWLSALHGMSCWCLAVDLSQIPSGQPLGSYAQTNESPHHLNHITVSHQMLDF